MFRREFLLSTTGLLLTPSVLLGQEPSKPASAQKDDIVFADFENGTYDGWVLEGNCWGNTPASDQSFPGKITGFQGKRFLCTYHPTLGNNATGKLVSKEFIIEKPFINFLIGGGNHPGEACLNLVVNGEIVRSETGKNTLELLPSFWEVNALKDKKAHFEIIDSTTSPDRGYIMVDNLTFSAPAQQPSVRVKPVFLLPSDGPLPTHNQMSLLMLRLRQTQVHFHHLLHGLDTYQISDEVPVVARARETMAQFYELTATDEGRSAVQQNALRLLFTMDRVDRHTCPFIYYIVITGVPTGRPDFGCPINGGVNQGGGIVITYCSGLTNQAETVEPRPSAAAGNGRPASYDLNTCGYLLRTVAHELGHALGLVHSNEYGYEGEQATSVMCNRAWRLIPEELCALGMNKRVFPNFIFDPLRDAPPDYMLKPLRYLGPAKVPPD